MDDDGDDDDDCGYLPKRQDRRERESERGHHAWSCLRPNGSSLLDDREGRKQHPYPCEIFSNSAQAPGNIMRRELGFFCYNFRECTLTTYLPTYLMQKEK